MGDLLADEVRRVLDEQGLQVDVVIPVRNASYPVTFIPTSIYFARFLIHPESLLSTWRKSLGYPTGRAL